MGKIQYKSYLKVFAVIAVILFVFFVFSFWRDAIDDSTLFPKAAESTVKLIAGNKTVLLQFIPGQTLYQLLSMEQNSDVIQFAGKEYSGIGFFITDIGDLHQGNGKYLFYYINGKEASLGVSSYVPAAGDIVEWKLK